MARFAAEAEAAPAAESLVAGAQSHVIFQRLFRYCTFLGLILTGLVWWARYPVAEWLNVPAAAVGLGSTMMLLILLRPVVSGMLQGREQFVALGSTRTIHAVGRFAAAVILVGLGGGGALAAIAAFPIGTILAILAGLLFLGLAVWRPGVPPPSALWGHALRLSAAAFVASAAYMSMTNSDLIWVNRAFPGETAGVYASAALLRRVIALLPGAVLVVMYPRVVARVANRQVPDSILWKTAAIVCASTVLLTGFYFAFGPAIVQLAFGQAYTAAAPLLGWMGVGMLGYGLGSVWMNLFLATKPLPFVSLLAALALLQHGLLALVRDNVQQAVAIFLAGGWVLALGGLLIYVLILRPQLVLAAREG
jgi:O-antigen/teichoic acid export membrane protein